PTLPVRTPTGPDSESACFSSPPQGAPFAGAATLRVTAGDGSLSRSARVAIRVKFSGRGGGWFAEGGGSAAVWPRGVPGLNQTQAGSRTARSNRPRWWVLGLH